jgi:hypothetical protein
MGGLFQNSTFTTTPQVFYNTIPDVDAQAFITAANITNGIQKIAIYRLVADLKGYSIWTKMKALYPVVGGTSAAHAVNLKTPGTYNLTFTGGWIHASTGMTPNGSSDYANTFLTFDTLGLNNQHISYYSRTNTLNQTSFDMGSSDGSSVASGITLSYSGGLGVLSRIGQAFTTIYTPTKTDVFQIVSANSTNVSRVFENGIYKGQNTGTRSTLGIRYYYIGAVNQTASNVNNGTPNFYSTRQCAFASIGDGLTDTEAANFYTAVQRYQITLNRQV